MKNSRGQQKSLYRTVNILLSIYQRVFSFDTGILGVNIKFIFHSVLGARICRFYPTCSDYLRLAISQYGLSRGAVMSLKRILKCGPWGRGGYDPVS